MSSSVKRKGMPGWLSIAICGGARPRLRVGFSVTSTHKAARSAEIRHVHTETPSMKPIRSSLWIALLLSSFTMRAMKAADPFQDPTLPIEKRVENLVSLLTLDEKIAMLGQVQPAIPRLNRSEEHTSELQV